MAPPGAGAQVLWHDTAAAGSNYALGCSSNGRRVACSFGLLPAPGPYLVVYNSAGQRLWSSDELGPGAASSAPIIGAAGHVIAADESAIYRFNARGQRMWRHDLGSPSGLPISPVLTTGGLLGYATTAGLVGAVDSTDGLGVQRTLDATISGFSGVFVTRNTPASRGNRIYVVAEFEADRATAAASIGQPARLYALDISKSQINVAWFVDVGGRSGASPTVSGDTIFFDADRRSATGPDAPHFFAVRDTGPSGQLVYAHPLTSQSVLPSGSGGALASAAHDPRGGLWLFTSGSPYLVRLSETPAGGRASVLSAINLQSLLGARAQPSSAITLTDGANGPVALMTALVGTRTHWLAIDLVGGTLMNDVDLGAGLSTWSAAQSPLVRVPGSTRTRAVLSTFSGGVVGIGAP